MSLSHSAEIENKPDVMQPIIDFLNNSQQLQRDYSSFEQAEKMIKQLVLELESAMVQEALSQYDINTPLIEHNGEIYHQVLRQEKTYASAAGLVSVERSLYRARAGQPCLCPLELQAGIIEDYWTPTAARLGCYVTAHLSPYQGEKLFKEFGGLQPSKSTLSRLSTRLGDCWETEQAQLEQALCKDITVPEDAVTVSASLDGIMIPLNKKPENGYKEAEPIDAPTPQDCQEQQEKKAKAFYREASCAAINFYDEEGERLKTLRFARMPEAGKKMLKHQLQQAMSDITLQHPDLNIVKIADGAEDNWRYLSDSLLPGEGTEILDYYHASEHLNKALEAAYGKGEPQAVAQYKKYRSLLKNEPGGIEKVIDALRYLQTKLPKNEVLSTELGYFRKNRHKMKYAQAIAANYPIGSGVTEAACKTLVTQRMKCAGMRWDIKGGQGVLTARSLIQSEQFDKGWKTLSEMYRGKITLPENVIAFRNNNSSGLSRCHN